MASEGKPSSQDPAQAPTQAPASAPAASKNQKLTMKSNISENRLPILKHENYSEWKIKITSLLKAKELFGIVESAPSKVELEDDNNNKANEEAKTIIYSSLDGKTTQSAGICEHEYELWQKVTGYYEGAEDDLEGVAISRFMEMNKQDIDVRHKWLNEHHDKKNIEISHISGDEQRADILTKPLHKTKFETNRKWLLGTMLAIFILLSLPCITIATAAKLRQTKPVYYRSSDVIYSDQLRRIHYKVVIMNPCETYFANITTKSEINKRLISDCNSAFSRIAKLDNCYALSRKARSAKTENVQTGSLDEASKFFHSIREGLGFTDDEDEIKQKSNKTTIESTISNNEIKAREKRVVPLLATLVIIVVSGMQIQTMHQNNVNVSNINELAQATNEERKFLQQGYNVLREVRENIHGIDLKLSHLEYRLDKIDRTIEQFPKIVALVNSYDSEFRELNEHLADIDNAARRHEASTAIFKIAKDNKWQDTLADQLQLESCEEEVNAANQHLTFNYRILVSTKNPKVKVMQAESFRFWNFTGSGKTCWMKYAGPKYILVNTTNSCHQDIQEYWITDKQISGHTCLKDNKQIETAKHIYHPDICRTNFKGSPNDIQIKIFNGYYQIYCYGNNIIVSSVVLECPQFVFELSLSEKFELGGEIYDLGEVSTVTINAIELHINNDISDQLKVDKLEIYGINTTKLDSSFQRLSRLTESIMRNITMVESPLNDWLYGPFITIGNAIIGLVSGFSTIISIVRMIGLLFPVLEITIIAWKTGKLVFSALVSPIQRLSLRWRTTRVRKLPVSKLRRYMLRQMNNE